MVVVAAWRGVAWRGVRADSERQRADSVRDCGMEGIGWNQAPLGETRLINPSIRKTHRQSLPMGSFFRISDL